MKPRPRKLLSLAALAIVLLVGLSLFGWFHREQPWQEATGWNLIDPELRAPMLGVSAMDESQPSIAWLGHAGFLIQWHGSRLLLDPNLGDHCTVSARFMERTVTPQELGHIDAALVSHAHFDHMHLDTLCAIPRLDTLILPDGSASFATRVQQKGARLQSLSLHESCVVGSLTVTAVQAAHNGHRYHPWASRHLAVGYVISDGATSIYFSGDTSFKNDFVGIRDRYHPDIAILAIGAYSPRIPLKRHHMSPDEAVEAALMLGSATVIPCHFGTFRLSVDAPDDALPRFATAAARKNLSWSMPTLLMRAEIAP